MDIYRVTLRDLRKPTRVSVKTVRAASREIADARAHWLAYRQHRRWRCRPCHVAVKVEMFDLRTGEYADIWEPQAETTGKPWGTAHGEG